MVLVLIAIAVGILIVAILIIKASKTSSSDVLGINLHCMKCGDKTNGAKCLKCEKDTQSFGV
jgi:hypothetical protein